MTHLAKPHNGFIKMALEDIRIARDFFTHYLPATLKEKINLETLTLQNGSFIEENYKESQTDILYSVIPVNESDQKTYIYLLLEAQSQPDKWMPFRLLKYLYRIIDQHQHQQKNDPYLPLVVPMVFYTGIKPYPYSMELQDLYRPGEEIGKSLLFGPYHRIDLHTISDETIYTHQLCGMLEMVMKHVAFRDALELLQSFLKPFLLKLRHEPRTDKYIIGMLEYITDRAEVNDISEFLATVHQYTSPTVEKNIMTIAEKLELIGEKRGEIRGELNGQYKMLLVQLEDRFGHVPLSIIRRLKNASSDELMKASRRLLHIQVITELFVD